jgi:hypothetical protein
MGNLEHDANDFATKFLNWWGQFAKEEVGDTGEYRYMTVDRLAWDVRFMGAY